MNFEDFEKLARLFVVGALEEQEEAHFEAGRRLYGQRAEALIAEFRRLGTVFALSLRPHPPHPDTKRKILHAIHQSPRHHRQGEGIHGSRRDGHVTGRVSRGRS